LNSEREKPATSLESGKKGVTGGHVSGKVGAVG
jgi:hypothetical protein